MRITTLVTIVTFAAVTQASDWKEKAQHMQNQYEDVKEVCTTKLGLTHKEVKDAETMDNPNTRREKCILACLLEELGLMEDGRFSRTKSDSIAEYLYEDDEDNLAIAKEVAKKCEKAVEAAKVEDECEVAAEIFKCIRKVGKQHTVKSDPDY